ncbi:adhesin aidA-I [Anaerovibrio sp. JC8]|uniref:autotransporter outer membrane beta-barrel domain-containing protein n=1 Tax=Anaerovibrio sp. JC8 TaxID=1240085 RepID=UPI000A0C0996|nr:autotransporter outer membrane beta-barrel domain-containing protein [Anaerovibrio sp. JC8]ORU00294.1 adhesin aidA-I [Anaerovibrio sp. JC8]
MKPMEGHSKKNWNLQKKLAVAMSLVNALNTTAPVALPYVNVARDMKAPGGQVQGLTDAFAAQLYSTAEATDYNVPDGSTTSVSVAMLTAGDKMNVNSGGIGTVGIVSSGGTQWVYNGGIGIISSLTWASGHNARQEIFAGGVGSVTSNNCLQIVHNSGMAKDTTIMQGGTQYVELGGTSLNTTVSAGGLLESLPGSILSGTHRIEAGGCNSGGADGTIGGTLVGTQHIKGLVGNVLVTGGSAIQYVYQGGTTNNVTLSNGGRQIVSSGGISQHTSITSGGKLLATSGGTLTGQHNIDSGGYTSGGTLLLYERHDEGGTTTNIIGVQEIEAGGTAYDITVGSGGTQIVQSGAIVTGTLLDSGGQILSSGVMGEAGTVSAITNNGYQTIYEGATGTVSALISGNQNISGGTGIVLAISSGGKQIVDIDSRGSAGTGTILTMSGGLQIVSANAGGTISTMNGGVQSIDSMGSGTVKTMNGGKQVILYDPWSPGEGTIEVMNGGTQDVSRGTGSIGTMKNGVQMVGNYAEATIRTMNGGTQIVKRSENGEYAGGHGTIEVMNGGMQSVEGLASGTIKTLVSGEQRVSGGTATIETMSGGTQVIADGYHLHVIESGGSTRVYCGGTATVENLSRGTQIVSSGGTSLNTTIKAGGTQIAMEGGALAGVQTVEAGGIASGGTLIKGAVQKVYGSAVLTTVNSGGIQDVASGGTASGTTINSGGVQSIASGGTANGAILMSGGKQEVVAGGVTADTVVGEGASLTLTDGGKTIVHSGRTTAHIILNGGTMVVEDYGKAQIDAATGGKLELLDIGLAEASFGDLTTPAGTSFTVTDAYARGDTVRLGLGDANGYSAPGKTLVLTNMDGYANFYVNTDLANNTSDVIKMDTVVNGTRANTVRINYDPTLAAGAEVTDTDTTVATVGAANKATFTGASSTIGGYIYLPTVTSTDAGVTWKITSVQFYKASNQMYAALGNASSKAAYWRQAGAPVIKRMAQLRRHPDLGNDFWVNFTRGKNSLDNLGYDVSATYSRMDIGFDRRVNANWTVGASYGLKYGSEGYSCGSGDSHDDILTAYGLWQGNGGRYSEITLRAGRLASHLDLQDPGQAVLSKGDNSTYGQAISFTYGQRMEKPDGWYMEPHVGFQWAHVNDYNYSLSDGSDVSVDASNSFIGNLGINVGREFGHGSTFYARADLMHDFAGGVRATMTRGMSNSLENDFKDTWLDLALGFRRQDGPVEWHIEVGRLGIGSKAAQGNWVWNVGMNYSF